MKLQKIIILLILSISYTIVYSQNADKDAIIEFEYIKYDYDTIQQNSSGISKFYFKNTGLVPLVINKVSTSCGCTHVSYPKKPIMPNQKGVIEVTYNTSQIGSFRKTIVVNSNAKNAKKSVLTIKGVVVKKK